jgi:hypothetical protein
MSKPRCAHYQLAHVALPSVAHGSPFEFMSAMASEAARELLGSLLEQVAEHCSDQPPDFGVDELVVHRARVLGSPCLVLELPEPSAPPEAYLVAAWLAINDGPESGQLRFFTLEAGDPALGPATVLGEWDSERKHVTYGAGPEPSVEGFTRAITALVARYH